MGGEEKINAYCHDLALEGGQILAKTLGTYVMDPEGAITLNMVPFSQVSSYAIRFSKRPHTRSTYLSLSPDPCRSPRNLSRVSETRCST